MSKLIKFANLFAKTKATKIGLARVLFLPGAILIEIRHLAAISGLCSQHANAHSYIHTYINLYVYTYVCATSSMRSYANAMIISAY